MSRDERGNESEGESYCHNKSASLCSDVQTVSFLQCVNISSFQFD